MNKLKQNSAITLIALVITIIVLLILAGLTLTFVLGENGIFGKARKAKEDTNLAQAVEDIQLKIIEAQVEGNGEFIWENFLDILRKAQDEYLVKTTSSQTSTLSSDDGGIINITGLDGHEGSVYVTNLTKYNYEVEIGSDFKIKNSVASSNSSGTGNYNSSNGGNSSSGSSSSLVFSSLSCSAVQSGSDFDITINPTFNQGKTTQDVYEYVILLNGTTIKSSNNTNCKIHVPSPNTDYRIKVMGIDTNAGIIMSNEFSIKSSNLTFTASLLDYPILTSNGVCNIKLICDQGSQYDYYDYDYDYGSTTATDAIGIDGYDESFETESSISGSSDKKIRIDESVIGKNVRFYISGSNQACIMSSSYGDLLYVGQWGKNYSKGDYVDITIPEGSSWFRIRGYSGAMSIYKIEVLD